MSDIKYVAFDVHKATISVAVLNLDGKLVTQAVIQTNAAASAISFADSAALSISLLKRAPSRSGSLT